MSPPHAISQGRTHGLPIAGEPRPGAQAALLASLLDEAHWPRRRLLIDLLVLYVASAAALFAAPVRAAPANRLLVALFPVVVLVLLRSRGGRDERIGDSMVDAVLHVLGVVSSASMAVLALGAIIGAPGSLGLTLRLWLFTAVYLGVAHAVIHWIRQEARIAGLLGTPTLIIGAGAVGSRVAERLLSTPSYGLRPVGFLDANPMIEGSSGNSTPVLGAAEDLAGAAARTGARQVILAFSSEPDSVLVGQVRECQRLGLRVSLVPRLFESINERSRLEHLGGVPLLSLDAADPHGWEFAVKHAMDRTIAALTLLLLGPLMLAIAAAVRMTSPGPALFRQRRVGRDGREFDVLKYRTMETAEPPAEFDLPDGVAPGGVEGLDRRTPVGRLLRASSLDELPQLINVLRGEMSLVGPRPERPEYVRRFAQDVRRYDDRHRVKAGITGWAQVNGLRGQTSIADRVEWDNHYIQNWSLWLDVKILLLTVGEVLRFRDSHKMRKYPFGRPRRATPREH